jgi:hypothetical protein
MSKIDRRTLIGVAGASVALAACGKVKGGDSQQVKTDGTVVDDFGVNPQWGENPHDNGPIDKPAGGFNPSFICIVYIKFDDGKKTIIRHGYIETGPKNSVETDTQFDARQIAAAESMFAAAAKGNWKANTSIGYSRKEVNFEKFEFGQQMRLFVVVDNDSVKFDDRKENGKYANLIRFTKYRTTQNMTDFAPETAAENHAYFGATLVAVKIQNKSRQALRVDNWYIGPKAAPIVYDDPKTHQYYAMNWQLLWQASDTGSVNQSIPFIIDPDGGNMGGTPRH